MRVDAEEILLALIRKYERSVLSRQGSERRLRIRFVMEQEMSEYFHYEYLQEAEILDETVAVYEGKHWISVMRSDYRITEVQLNTAYVEEIYHHLNLGSAGQFHRKLITLLEKYRGKGIDSYINDVEQKIQSYKSVKPLVFEDLNLQEDLLKSLCALIVLQKDTLERVFSAEVLQYSKAFEPIRSKTAKILRLYFEGDSEAEDEELLAQFHVLKNPGHLILKGHGTIQIKDSVLVLDDFEEGLTLSSSDVENICTMDLADSSVMTIENLTTFYQCSRPDTLIIYLGGYHNTVRRQFLKRIYETWPEKTYYHFGDIDAGGFYILEHLKRKTGIPFRSYLMNTDTLEKYSDQTIPLTENDRKRLQAFAGNEAYADVIRRMLDLNRKLEQEQICSEDMV